MTHPRGRHHQVRALRATDPLAILLGLITFAIMALIMKAFGRV